MKTTWNGPSSVSTISSAFPTTSSIRSRTGLASKCRRAIAACCSSTSSVMTTPPTGSRSAIDRAVTPVNVPISSTRVALVAVTRASSSRVSTRPPAISGMGMFDSVSARSTPTAADGTVVWATAYSSISWRIISMPIGFHTVNTRSLFVAGLQIAPVALDPEATLTKFEDQVRGAAGLFDELQLVVAPELHLMAGPGLLDRGEDPEQAAVAVPGALTERLGVLARDTGLWLIPGSVYERDEDSIYNTALVFSPTGELVTSYRKCFPWQPYETSRPGRRTVCFDIDGIGRFGLAICH